jgi:predicted amidohydrolase
VTRYDKRFVSATERTHMYTPGREPVVFDIGGFRFGMMLCLEILFPELFVDYAALGVDAVLVSSAADPKFGLLARAHALMNMFTVSLSMATGPELAGSAAGIAGWDGWLAAVPHPEPGLAVADIGPADHASSFQSQARTGVSEAHPAATDPRSMDRKVL